MVLFFPWMQRSGISLKFSSSRDELDFWKKRVRFYQMFCLRFCFHLIMCGVDPPLLDSFVPRYLAWFVCLLYDSCICFLYPRWLMTDFIISITLNWRLVPEPGSLKLCMIDGSIYQEYRIDDPLHRVRCLSMWNKHCALICAFM